MVAVSVDRLNEFLYQGLPQAREMGVQVIGAGVGTATLRLPVVDSFIRPGGTLSGPAQMALADMAMWIVVASEKGEIPLAVTTSFNINFVRKPPMVDVIAEGKMIKLGKRLAVMEVTLCSADNAEEVIAHATGTYSIPPDTVS